MYLFVNWLVAVFFFFWTHPMFYSQTLYEWCLYAFHYIIPRDWGRRRGDVSQSNIQAVRVYRPSVILQQNVKCNAKPSVCTRIRAIVNVFLMLLQSISNKWLIVSMRRKGWFKGFHLIFPSIFILLKHIFSKRSCPFISIFYDRMVPTDMRKNAEPDGPAKLIDFMYFWWVRLIKLMPNVVLLDD